MDRHAGPQELVAQAVAEAAQGPFRWGVAGEPGEAAHARGRGHEHDFSLGAAEHSGEDSSDGVERSEIVEPHGPFEDFGALVDEPPGLGAPCVGEEDVDGADLGLEGRDGVGELCVWIERASFFFRCERRSERPETTPRHLSFFLSPTPPPILLHNL